MAPTRPPCFHSLRLPKSIVATPTLLCLLLACMLPSSQTSSQRCTPRHGWEVFYDWALPAATTKADRWRLDNNFTITLDPGPSTYYYWSHFIWFTDGDAKTQGAYWGLQTNGDHKSLIFSVWGGVSGVPDLSAAGRKPSSFTGTTASYCSPFEEDGAGYHCLYAYPWAQNVSYTFRTEVVDRNATGDQLRCTMYDPVTRKTATVGTIFVPVFLGVPSTTVYFYEYYSDVPKYTSIPEAAASYSNLALTMLPASGRAVLAPQPALSNVALDALGGGCGNWAGLSICNTTVRGSSPAIPPLTSTPGNSCKPASTWLPSSPPGNPVPGNASTASSVDLSGSGSVMSGAWIGPSGGAALAATPFLSTSVAQTPANATWILLLIDNGTAKMVQVQVLAASGQATAYASAAGYAAVPAVVTSTSVNAAWRQRTPTSVASCATCCCYGISKLATSIRT